MNNKIRFIICAAAITLTASLFSGCGSSKTDSANTLVIWSEYSSNEHKAIEQIANEWAKGKGCNVKVIETTNGLDSYITAVRSGGGPDLNIGVSQDEILNYARASVLSKVPEGTIDKTKFTEQAINAGAYNGELYGQPITVEPFALYYNKDLIKDVPKNWDELIKEGKQKGLKWDLYDSRNRAAFDNESQKNTYLKQIYSDKIMTASDTGDIPEQLFLNKKIAFLASGSWVINKCKDSKVNFGVAAIPDLEGKAALTFSTYRFSCVSSRSNKQKLAWDFLKYSYNKLPKALFDLETAIPATNEVLDSTEANKDPAAAQFVQLAKVNQN